MNHDQYVLVFPPSVGEHCDSGGKKESRSLQSCSNAMQLQGGKQGVVMHWPRSASSDAEEERVGWEGEYY